MKSAQIERKSVAEMFGEFLREAAVLVAVFMPLDQMVTQQRFTWVWICCTLLMSSTLLVTGMIVERGRKT